jgi:hypothetical protein
MRPCDPALLLALVLLAAGSPYWLIAAAADPASQVVWLINAVHRRGPRASAADQGYPPDPISWTVHANQDYGAFRLVPEPGGLLAIALAAASLSHARRR